MKPKILFLITKSNFGGAQKYVYDLAISLRASYDVSVALGGDGKLSELLSLYQIPVHPIPHLQRDISFKKELASFGFIYRLCRSEKPDILHLNSSKAGFLGALAGRCARVPHIVFTAHGWAWNEERPLYAKIVIAFLHWLTVMFAHRTICVSHSVYDQMAKFPFTKRRMRVIHLGITPLMRISREQARASLIEQFPALKERDGALWIATIAELHPIKGFPYALRAIRKLKETHSDIVYVIMGEGEERPLIESYIKNHHLEETIFLAGYVTDAPSLLFAFDLFLLASFSESFGYVLIEAGAAKVPVVATRVGGMVEIIEDEGGILVPPKNTELLVDALHTLATDKKKRASSVETLYERVQTYFTKERMVEETENFYRDLMR